MDAAFLSLLLATVLLSAWGLLARKVLKVERDYFAAGTLMEAASTGVIFIALAALAFLSFPEASLSLSGVPMLAWLLWITAIVLYTAFIYITYKANQTAEAAERSVLNQLQIPVATVLSAIFLSEPLSATRIAGAALVMAGAVICTYKPGFAHWKREGLLLAASAALIVGAANVVDKVAIQSIPIILYSLPLYVVPFLFGLFSLGPRRMQRLGRAYSFHGAWLLAVGAFSVASYLFYLFALARLPVSLTITLFNTNVVLTALGGMLLLSEKTDWKQKLLGALLAFAGAALAAA